MAKKAAGKTKKVVDDLYTLLEQQVNAKPIRDVLKEFKSHYDKDVSRNLAYGSTKSQNIRTLREAVKQRLIPDDVPLDLLREHEENGQQHIFYYKPKNATIKAKCRDFDTVVEQLLGEEQDGFPIFALPPLDDLYEGDGSGTWNYFQWVDYRRAKKEKPQDWIFKAYGHEVYFERVDVQRPTWEKRVEYYEAEPIRIVCLVRWNDPDILEIRIDSERLDSRKTKDARLKKIWEMLSPALNETEFKAWDLLPARTFMAANREGHLDFTINDLRLVDSDGGVSSFKTNTTDESVDDLNIRSTAINALTEDEDTTCDILTVHWKDPHATEEEEEDEDDLDDEEVQSKKGKPWLTTVCGGRYTNELVVRARTSAEAIDHVSDKLREFNS